MNWEFEERVASCFRSGEIAAASEFLEKQLKAFPVQRFASLSRLSFTNLPAGLLSQINAFIELCGQQFDVQAVYLEMNGFDINYSRWFFDFFAYSTYSAGDDDLDWLCDWQSPEWPSCTLTGLEEIQVDYRWYNENKKYKEAPYVEVVEIANLLVMVRFVQLIEETLNSGPLVKEVPLLVTAHDFDTIARFEG